MPLISRRTSLAAIASSCLIPSVNPAMANVRALRETASSKGLLFGAAVLSRLLRSDPGFAAAISSQCNVLVAEGEMKWDSLERQQGTLTFASADNIVAFAREHAQSVRGHTLLWHQTLPPWVAQAVTEGRGEQLIERHVGAVCRHFGDQILCWDVVNEAVKPDEGRPDGLRRTLWLEHLGPEYLDITFRAARSAAPHTPLIYNDFGLEQDEKWQDIKRAKVLQLLEGFRRRQVPVDGVGIQAHLNAAVPFDAAKFRAFLRAIAQMGFVIHITELDVNDSRLAADIASRDQAVADLTRRVLDVALDEPKVTQLLTWGLSDKYTWLNATPNKKRADGLAQRPLPLDEQFRPKPMFDAIHAALSATTVRPAATGVQKPPTK
jgi:endo-1,4-beta-xylanase